MNGKSKSSSTRKLLGIDFGNYKRWLENWMTPVMNWKTFDIDQVRAMSSFDVSKDEELKESFKWKKTQPF